PYDDDEAFAVRGDIRAHDDTVFLVAAFEAHVLGKPGRTVIQGAIEIETESALPLVDPDRVNAAVGVRRQRGNERRRLRVDAVLGIPRHAAVARTSKHDELVARCLPTRLPGEIQLVRTGPGPEVGNDGDSVAHRFRTQILLVRES